MSLTIGVKRPVISRSDKRFDIVQIILRLLVEKVLGEILTHHIDGYAARVYEVVSIETIVAQVIDQHLISRHIFHLAWEHLAQMIDSEQES